MGAARIHALIMYRFPTRCRGMTSPLFVSTNAPACLPNLLSYPKSAHLLRAKSGLWTLATCMHMCLGWLAPSVQMANCRSPRFGSGAEFATSYYSSLRDISEGDIAIPSHGPLAGITESQAPVSAVMSILIHSPCPTADNAFELVDWDFFVVTDSPLDPGQWSRSSIIFNNSRWPLLVIN